MNLTLIITLSFFAISVILALLAQKKVFRTINTVFTSVSLVLALLSIAIYFDGQHVQEQLAGEKIFILHDGTVRSGFIHATDTPSFVKDLSSWRSAYGTPDFESIRNSRLMFIATPKTFDRVSSIAVGDFAFTKDKAMTIILSDDPITIYKNEIKKQANLPEGQGITLPETTPDELRGFMFASLIAEYFETTTPVNALNSGELDVQPKFIMLWLVTKLPSSWLPYLISTEVP